MKLYSFDPLLSVLALALVLGGLLSVKHLGLLLKTATKLYVASLVLTEQLLAEYWERLSAHQWAAFQHTASWNLLGFGLVSAPPHPPLRSLTPHACILPAPTCGS